VVARRGVDLCVTAPPLVPTSDFYNRHVRNRSLRDRDISAGRFKDPPSYVPGGSAVLMLAGRPGRQPGNSNDGPAEWTPPDQAYWCRDEDHFPTILARYRAST
jgi:hypothetical protein